MKIELELINKTKQKISSKEIKDWAEKILLGIKKEKRFLEKTKLVELGIALVGEKEIRKLNAYYRNKDKKTDILSFCYENNPQFLSGELIFCLQVIKENAQKDKISWKEEFKKNLVHGILHLIGFVHSSKMFSYQEILLEKIKNKK